MPSLLFTAENRAKILTAIERGSDKSGGARAARVSPRTLRGWLEEGETEQLAGRDTEYSRFYEDFLTAQSYAENIAITMLRKAMLGDYVTRRSAYNKKILVDGQMQEVEVREEHLAGPDVKALTFWLERVHPQSYGRLTAAYDAQDSRRMARAIVEYVRDWRNTGVLPGDEEQDEDHGREAIEDGEPRRTRLSPTGEALPLALPPPGPDRDPETQ